MRDANGAAERRPAGRDRLKAWAERLWPMYAAMLCAALCLAIGLFSTPRLYPVDFGQYELVLRETGLTWTEADQAAGDLQYDRPLTHFQYTRFAWSNLMTPDAGSSIVYPVAVVRLFTEPFGLDFSVDALALVFGVMLCLATGLLTMALYRLIRRLCWVPCIMLCMMFADGNFCAMFRGLYPEGAAIAFSLLLAGLYFYALSVSAARRVRWVPATVVCSVLALKSLTPLIVFLPFIAVLDLALILSCRGRLARSMVSAALCLALLVIGANGAIRLAGDDPDYFSQASVYESVFNTMLPSAESPQSILDEFGLDESYAADIGLSYYEEASAYAHNPRDEAEARVLFDRMTPWRVVRCYLRHPGLLARVIGNLPVSVADGYINARNRVLRPNDLGFAATRTDAGPFGLLMLFQPLTHRGFIALYALAFAVCIALAALRRRAGWLSAALFALGCALYLPFAAMLNGRSLCAQYILYGVFLTGIALTAVLMLILWAAPYCRRWISRYAAEPFAFIECRPWRARRARTAWSAADAVRRAASFMTGDRRRIVAITAVLAAAMLIATLLPLDHAASVNNGDFGRMMEQMDLTWTGAQFYDTDSQAGRFAIEEYEYTRPFDPLKLTPARPTYSLYWFVSLVRLVTQPFGMCFSTYALAWVMGVIALLCVLQITRDLYPLLGRWTLLAAALLCAAQLSETYLTWYNSLYGEGCILLGLLMTMMCALHLCVMPSDNRTLMLWQIALAVSLYILVGAKSQMLLAAPGAIALLLAMNWYRKPRRYDLQAVQWLLALGLCAALAVCGLGVYRSDRSADSVSEKHTMWQAYFYGIFMISDDPIADMQALGVDTAMAPDIGKFVQFSDDAEYVYAPLSEEAQRGFYDHVSMATILKWYLLHPTKLWRMLDHAASESKALYTGFRVYAGQDYAMLDHDRVDGRNLWPGWRVHLTPGSFFGYLLFYGALLFLLIRAWIRTRRNPDRQMLCALPLFLILTGALQFPLSVLGNGFADNQKQLFCFALCHDWLLGGVIVVALRELSTRSGRLFAAITSVFHRGMRAQRRRIEEDDFT